MALSVLGASIKLGPWSIAFDAASGFVAALALGPGPGALVCGLGHLAAAAASGFPLSLPFHLMIGLTMAGVGFAGGLVARRSSLGIGAVTLIIANGVVAPAVLAVLPNPMGPSLFMMMLLPLTVGAAANALVAVAVVSGLRRSGWIRP